MQTTKEETSERRPPEKQPLHRAYHDIGLAAVLAAVICQRKKIAASAPVKAAA